MDFDKINQINKTLQFISGGEGQGSNIKRLSYLGWCLLFISCSPNTKEPTSIPYDSFSEKKELVVSKPADFTVEQIRVVPDFSRFRDVNEKKEAFFCFLKPIIDEENELLRKSRNRMLAIFHHTSKGGIINEADMTWLCENAKKLRVRNFDLYDSKSRLALEKKLDIIPEAMCLAQAANESAWGTSLFATKANNFFGQWCFRPGCGIVPANRPAGANHEVRKFKTVNASVRSYMTNLNKHRAYRKMWELRYQERKNNGTPSGFTCAGGLLSYSAKRGEYVKEIRAIIKKNKLE
ncbi:MAG: glucosaminidase domain-containing protein [Cyclobacteriaceae bacterium]